ncbi:MAG: cysteine desulfurase family protein [Minisyncoccia bacterium]
MKTIYLDNASSTPLRHEVLEAMIPHLENSFGNASSLHHMGRIAHTLLEDARHTVSSALDVKAKEIIFTSGGTEANNLALFGVAQSYRVRGMHILLSSIEHPSILEAGARLSQEGFDVEYLPVDRYGQISVKDTLTRIRPDTILISIMLANNEIGTIEPIAELSSQLRKKFSKETRPFFHTDACQALGQIPITPDELGIDLMTLNSTKVYGPKGVGLLYVREGISLTPQMVGGAQEFGKRAGTENIPSIIGFAHALKLALTEQVDQSKKLIMFRNKFFKILKKKLPQLILNGHPEERLPNNIHISLPHIEGESLVLMLDTYGICASTGSACSAHDLLPSHVLRAIGQSPEVIHGSLRFTLGRDTTEEDLTYTAHALSLCAGRLLSMSPLPLYV